MALAVCGAGNVLLTQTAYQTGQPMITLPIIAAVTPVTSVAVGIGLLGETPETGVAGAVGAAFAVLITSLALARLARSAPHPEPHPEPQPAPRPALVPDDARALADGSFAAGDARDDDSYPGRRVLAGAGAPGR